MKLRLSCHETPTFLSPFFMPPNTLIIRRIGFLMRICEILLHLFGGTEAAQWGQAPLCPSVLRWRSLVFFANYIFFNTKSSIFLLRIGNYCLSLQTESINKRELESFKTRHIMESKKSFSASLAVLAMAGAMVLSSCNSKEEYSYSPERAHENVFNEYKANFVKYYGEVNPNETWDFSMRGSQLAGFAGTRKDGTFSYSPNVQDMKDNQSYGYNWKHSNDHSSEINELGRLYWDKYIKDAIDAAPESDWNPSGKIIFDVLITTQDQNSSAGYFTWGIADTPQGDLFMRQVSPANGRNWKNGNTGQQHTSSLDFSMIPDGVTWFTSHTAQNQKKYKIDYNTNSNIITKFKNVTVTIPETGKTYTFWCFKCDASPYADYKDLVLWVSDFETIRTPVASKRYMVEDLGGADDFDFNDVVFDVVRYDDGTTWCYVRALGGILDVTIDVAGSTWIKSQHYDPYTQMLNTSNIDKDACLGEFQVTGTWDDVSNTNVSVTVKAEEELTQGGGTVFYYTVPFPAVGSVPLIIATPISKTWRRERDRITDINWFTISDIDLGQ